MIFRLQRQHWPGASNPALWAGGDGILAQGLYGGTGFPFIQCVGAERALATPAKPRPLRGEGHLYMVRQEDAPRYCQEAKSACADEQEARSRYPSPFRNCLIEELAREGGPSQGEVAVTVDKA